MQGDLQTLFAILDREVENGGEGNKQIVRRVGEALTTKLDEIEQREKLQPLVERKTKSAAATDGDYVVEDKAVLHLADQAMRDFGYVCHPHAGYPTYTQHISLPQSQDSESVPRQQRVTAVPSPPPPEQISDVFVQPHRPASPDVSPQRSAAFEFYSPYPNSSGEVPPNRIGSHNKSLSPPIDRRSPARTTSPTRTVAAPVAVSAPVVIPAPVAAPATVNIPTPVPVAAPTPVGGVDINYNHSSNVRSRTVPERQSNLHINAERARRNAPHIREGGQSLADDIKFALSLKESRLTDSKLNRALHVVNYRLDRVIDLQNESQIASRRSPSRNQSPERSSSATTRRLFRDQSRQPRDVISAYNESVKFAATLRLEMDPSQRSAQLRTSRVRPTSIAPKTSRKFNHVSNKGGDGRKKKKKKSSPQQQQQEPQRLHFDETLEPQHFSTAAAAPHQYSPPSVVNTDRSRDRSPQRYHMPQHINPHLYLPPHAAVSPEELKATITNFVSHVLEDGNSAQQVCFYSFFFF